MDISQSFDLYSPHVIVCVCNLVGTPFSLGFTNRAMIVFAFFTINTSTPFSLNYMCTIEQLSHYLYHSIVSIRLQLCSYSDCVSFSLQVLRSYRRSYQSSPLKNCRQSLNAHLSSGTISTPTTTINADYSSVHTTDDP